MSTAAEGENEPPIGEQDVVVRMRVLLFRNTFVQQSLRRFWHLLARNDELTMEDFVNLNVRLQKILVPEFKYDAAIESAVADWQEEFGKDLCTDCERFVLFLFELGLLWAAKSLQSALLFFSVCYLAASKSEGPRTIALKPIEECEYLPDVFFELLDAESTRNPANEEELNAWCLNNLGQESEIVLTVQRTVFRLMHDIRAVRLFSLPARETDVLDVAVKHQVPLAKGLINPALERTITTVKIKPSPHGLSLQADPRTGQIELPTGWTKYAHQRAPVPQKRHAAAPMLGVSSGGAALTTHEDAIEKAGRRKADPRLRSPPRSSLAASGAQSLQLGASKVQTQDQVKFRTVFREEAQLRVGTLVTDGGLPSIADVSAIEIDPISTRSGSPTAQELVESPLDDKDWTALAHELTAAAPVYGTAAEALGLAPKYELPIRRQELPQRRVDQAFKPAKDVIYKARANYQIEKAPFDKAVGKLSKQPVEGELQGPFLCRSEPLWFEMNGRLEAIMNKAEKRQGRRRRKSRARKQRTQKADEGRDLRKYLNKKANEFAQLEENRYHEVASHMPSEFIEHVEEGHLTNRVKRLELEERFLVRASGNSAWASLTNGPSRSPKSAPITE